MGNDVITNVISANQRFTSTFSMQIFKSKDDVASSPSFSRPTARAPRRAYLQAIMLPKCYTSEGQVDGKILVKS